MNSNTSEMSMTAEALWNRYSAIWTLPDDGARRIELSACLADDATYCDPNGLIESHAALSEYMASFQQSVPPGAKFHLSSLLLPNDRTLAHWALLGPDGGILQRGTSFGALSSDGRLHAITGFFHPADAEPAAA
jgi:hypothetical protein